MWPSAFFSLNLILFEPFETSQPLLLSDGRAVHILNVLRRKIGDTCDVGLIDGPRGKAELLAVNETSLDLAFTWELAPPALDPIHLIVGLPRPQTARKILQEAATLGVAAIDFVRTERSDASYAQSTLWSTGEWRRHLIAGAEQAFSTQLPSVRWDQTLAAAIAADFSSATTWASSPPHASERNHVSVSRVALDNYEATTSLLTYSLSGDKSPARKTPASVILAIGGERGWTQPERDGLRAQRFTLAHLGSRVLRTETAVVASLAIIKAAHGWI